MNSITKAVIYARYSSHNQREESIEGQLRVCSDYAQRNGIKIIDEYIDRAQSATTDRRPAFQKMIKDSRKRNFDLVLVYNLDRFARSRFDSAKYKAILKSNGVQLKSVTQAIPDGPDGIILESVMEGINEYYSANLARNVKRGMTENALSFRVNGQLPLGYRKGADGCYEIDPVEAEVVQEIFKMYAEGISKRAIIDRLNEDRKRTKSGKPFKLQSLDRILKNRRYTGVYIFGSFEQPDAIPVIVPLDLFEKAQVVMQKKRRVKGRMTDQEYILTGKLFCGHCEKPMVGESGKSRNGEVYRYYKCQTAKRKSGACEKKSVRKEKLEDWVVSGLQDQILTDENIEMISQHVFEIYQKDLKDTSHLDLLQTDLKECNSKIQNILNAIEAGIFTKSTKDRLQDLEAEKEELEEAIEIEQGREAALTLDMISDYLFQLRSGAEASADYRKAIIDTFVDKIYLYDDKGVILFRLTTDGKPQEIEGSVSDMLNEGQPFEIDPGHCPGFLFSANRTRPVIFSPYFKN